MHVCWKICLYDVSCAGRYNDHDKVDIAWEKPSRVADDFLSIVILQFTIKLYILTKFIRLIRCDLQ